MEYRERRLERKTFPTSMRLRPRVTATVDLGVVLSDEGMGMGTERPVASGSSCELSTPIDCGLAVRNDELTRCW